METPFTRVNIFPSYAKGFTFLWEISQGFSDPLPWTFTVQEGPGHEGPWNIISPPLANTMAWVEDGKRVVGKDLVLFFRVVLTTPKGVYTSHIKHPYGDLNRRDYLIVKDIMRREVIQASTLSGVTGRLWASSVAGAPCTECLDPITGEVTVPNCDKCYGSGRVPPYHGPYTVWMTFSPLGRKAEQNPDGTGLKQIRDVTIRMVGFPIAKSQDIAIDVASDKRYHIETVRHELEIRRIPVIQVMTARELPVSDPLYRLGTDVPGADCTISEE